MNEEELRRYLNQGEAAPVRKAPKMRVARRPARQPQREESSFKNFSATHLLCPTCKKAMPVRERLVLVLPDGDLYDYACSACGTSCGKRKG